VVHYVIIVVNTSDCGIGRWHPAKMVLEKVLAKLTNGNIQA